MSVKVENINNEDLKNICRTCLKHCDVEFPQDITIPKDIRTSLIISDIYHKLTDINFETNDDLPKQVCINCYKKMVEIHEFSLLCKESYSSLAKYLNKKLKSNEPEMIEEHFCQEDNFLDSNEFKTDEIYVKQENTENVDNSDYEDTPEINEVIIKDEIIDDLELNCASPDLEETFNLLPPKSRTRYEKAYKQFLNWCEEKNAANYTEIVLMEYFNEKIKVYQSSTLWSLYAMIKATLIVKNNIDISKYTKLIALLKRKTNGYRAKKCSIFTKDQIEKFLCDAPDQKYLMMKVCTIFGVAGACRRDELTQLTIDDIEDVGSALLVKINDAQTKKTRNFTIWDKKINGLNLLDFYRKYSALRPPNTEHRRFFVSFNFITQKCSTQVVGINTIGKIPTEIAKFLGLANPRSYTGHCFRRSSAALVADAGADASSMKRHGGRKNIV